jgi:membrane protein YdbS with pleckstrin-like domain
VIRDIVERLLRLPPAPEPPPGDESSARVFRAAPRYFQYRVVMWCIGTGLLLIGVGIPIVVPVVMLLADYSRGRAPGSLVFIVVTLTALVALFLVLARLLSLAVLRLDYERRWYVVTDRSLRIREGIWIVREITVTFANIQNLAVTQGPIQRVLGLYDLRVDTAGGGGGTAHGGKGSPMTSLHAAVFRGIDNADEIKGLIQERLRALKDAGLGDTDDHATPSFAPDTALLDALRGVHAEAQALRAAIS